MSLLFIYTFQIFQFIHPVEELLFEKETNISLDFKFESTSPPGGNRGRWGYLQQWEYIDIRFFF